MKVPVLIPKIFNYPFTYSSTLENKLKQGDIVVVPFGKNLEIGVVWDKLHETEKKIKIKEIHKKVENFSINKSLIKFINWFSMYNLASKGKVLKIKPSPACGSKPKVNTMGKIVMAMSMEARRFATTTMAAVFGTSSSSLR